MHFTEGQARTVATTFVYISGLLDEVERAARETNSPFAADRPDLSDAERDAIGGLVAEARTQMQRALNRFGLAPRGPRSSARWTIRTALLSSDIALSELSGRTLGRYGEVDRAVAKEVDAVATELRRLLARGLERLGASARD